VSKVESKGYIHIARVDRLGGRLISMYHGTNIAHKFDLPYQISWPDFHDFEVSNYQELFSEISALGV
jgi:hypothetical protein